MFEGTDRKNGRIMIKINRKIEIVLKYALIACLVGLLISIFISNLVQFNSRMLDFDSSTIMGTAKEMYFQKRLFLSNWSYQSTMLLDSTEPLTAIVLLFTHDVFFAQGIANAIWVLFFLVVLFLVYRELNLGVVAKVSATVLFIAPWGREYLGYYYCLFTETACYLPRLVIQLLVIYSYLSLSKRIAKIPVILSIFSGISVFISTISSGLHAFIFFVTPIFFAELIICLVKEGHNKKYRIGEDEAQNGVIVYSAFLMIAVVGGLVTKKYFGYGATGGNEFITALNVHDNIRNTVMAIPYLLHVLPDGPVRIVSKTGFMILLKIALFMLMVYSFFYCIKRTIEAAKEGESYRDNIILLLEFFVGFGVLCLTKTTYGGGVFYEYRYIIFIIGAIFLLTGKYVDEIMETKNNTILRLFVLFLLVSIGVTFNIQLYRNHVKTESEINKELLKYKETIESQGVDTVIVYDNYELARMLNVYDLNHKYVDLRENMTMVGWGIGYAGYEHKMLGDDVLFITGDTSILRPYHGEIELLERVNNNYVYHIRKQKMDFSAMMPLSNSLVPEIDMQILGNSTVASVIDYPYTPGITINEDVAEIDETGILQLKGEDGIAMLSPPQRTKGGTYEFIIRGRYKADGDVYFKLYGDNSKTILSQKMIDQDVNVITCTIDECEKLCYSIENQGGKAEIISVEVSYLF